MRLKVNGSAWGMRDYVNDLTSDGNITPDEIAKDMKGQVDELKNDPQSIKYLQDAIRDKILGESGEFTSVPNLLKADQNALEGLLKKMLPKS